MRKNVSDLEVKVKWEGCMGMPLSHMCLCDFVWEKWAEDVTCHCINFPWEERGYTACLKQMKLDLSPICPFSYKLPPTALLWTSSIPHTTVPKIQFWILFNSLILNPKTLYLILPLFQESLPHPVLVSALKYVPWKITRGHPSATKFLNTFMCSFHLVTGTYLLLYLYYEIKCIE